MKPKCKQKQKRIGCYTAHERNQVKLGKAIACLMDAQRILAGVSMNNGESASFRLGEAHGLVQQVRTALALETKEAQEKVASMLMPHLPPKAARDSLLRTLLEQEMTPGQRKLAKKHGTPAEFAQAVYAAVPGDISMDEAEAALLKYRQEWREA